MLTGSTKHLQFTILVLTLATAITGRDVLAANMDPVEWCSRAVSEPARITCLEEAEKNKTGQTPNFTLPPDSQRTKGTTENETGTSDNPDQKSVKAK